MQQPKQNKARFKRPCLRAENTKAVGRHGHTGRARLNTAHEQGSFELTNFSLR